MNLTVFSHKPCWTSTRSPSGYATDGGFAFQMRALSQLFDATRVLVPCRRLGGRSGETPLTGHNLSVTPLTPPSGRGLGRKLALPFWMARNGSALLRGVSRTDAVHAPIPGDIGTIGMLMAWAIRKPLFVRHCGNWLVQRTATEHFWRWFIERWAGGRNVMLVTGGSAERPSKTNANVHWIFSTSLTERQLVACGKARDRAPGKDPRLIIACRQDPEKGTGVVIQAVPHILRNYPGAKLDVVGDGPMLEDFEDLARRLGVADRVTFHGHVGHDVVLRLFREADVLCFPTASEGFPKVVLEALACGLPVITTRVSVLPQLLASGCGRLIDHATPEVVADAVAYCLSNGPRYVEMSRLAVTTARQFSVERWRDTIGDFIRKAWGPLQTDEGVGTATRYGLAMNRREGSRR